jgi:hypothetical protein
MKGIVIGYLNSSPFEALTLAIMMHIIFIIIRKIRIGMPTMIIHRGATRIIYRSMESWKLSEFLPF